MSENLSSVRLTRRQRDCMELVAEGSTAKCVARVLNISHRTVEQHIAAAIAALGATNRLEAVARFVELKREENSASSGADFMLRTPTFFGEVGLIEIEKQAKDLTPEKPVAWPLFPPLGGSPNDAPRGVRLSWIVRIAVSALMLTSAVTLSVLGLIEMAQ